jgi:hypothetical protein
MTSFATIFIDYTNIVSAQTPFFRRAFTKQLSGGPSASTPT